MNIRLRFEPDLSPDHSWIEQDWFTDENKRVYWAMVEKEGMWTCLAEFQCLCCGNWVIADSISGLVGQDAHEYTSDLEESARKAFELQRS